MTSIRGFVALAALGAVAGCGSDGPEPPPPPPPAAAQHLLSVRQHAALPAQLDQGRVDGIFVAMTELVQAADGSTDVACQIGFARFGQLGTFTNDEIPFSINNEADFRRVDGIGGSVKVVGEINWCGRLGVGIIGCASTPGPRLAVVRFTPDQEAVLWTHEFGHTTGSPHRDGEGALMQPFIGVDHRGVDQAECTRLIAGSDVVQSGSTMLAAHATDVSDRALPASARESSALIRASAAGPEPVQSFVRKGFFEGVPYNQAKLYSDDDVPELQRLLQDPAAEDTWRNVVGTLGAIGTERAKAVLIAYLLADRDARLSPAAYIAKSDVPVALGWLVHKSDDPEALELLIKATDGDWWVAQGINWSTPIHRTRDDLVASLVTKAIIGLTLSGTEEAEIRLAQLQGQLDPGARAAALSRGERAAMTERLGSDAVASVTAVSPATREAVLQSGGDRFLEAQVQELRAVQAGGLERYYGE
jgi:hypothetical protein